MEDRIERFREKLKEKGVEAFLVTHLPNVRYLVGFTGSAGALLVLPDEVHFFTDFRYKVQSSLEIGEGVEIHITNESLQEISRVLRSVKKLGFEAEYMSYLNYKKLDEKTGWLEKVPLEGLVMELRSIKEEKEIELIKNAQKITDSIFSWILENFKPDGVTEAELAAEMEYRMRKMGAKGPAFDTIVATGRHSALPHARPRKVQIGKNDILLLDFGAVYEGYASDMTRTLWIGSNPKKKFKEIYEIVNDAVNEVVGKAKPGMTGVEIDALAREYIKSKGYGEYFGHGLGHGVGLEVHEKPVLSPKFKGKIEKNSVFTIEPGIYLPQFGGVRIEELAVMKENGVEVITESTRDLIKL